MSTGNCTRAEPFTASARTATFAGSPSFVATADAPEGREFDAMVFFTRLMLATSRDEDHWLNPVMQLSEKTSRERVIATPHFARYGS